ncbi:hypothetical protein MLD38_015081 [Melastoma candidum]|uniref:Uncharacterized protein n=1 Tax=Melastoma candidum TaxID=119954 RepID=A0ACB9RGA6_9MYRT|nr:hypothetical protein MLD38_015081 [Melastoma candidum]
MGWSGLVAGRILQLQYKKDDGSPRPEGQVNGENAKGVNYGRIITFGKDVAELHSSKFERTDFTDAIKGTSMVNTTSCDVWIEYHDMGVAGVKAVADYKVFTAGSFLDALNFVAPKLMKRGNAHFSYGIADDLDDPRSL